MRLSRISLNTSPEIVNISIQIQNTMSTPDEHQYQRRILTQNGHKTNQIANNNPIMAPYGALKQPGSQVYGQFTQHEKNVKSVYGEKQEAVYVQNNRSTAYKNPQPKPINVHNLSEKSSPVTSQALLGSATIVPQRTTCKNQSKQNLHKFSHMQNQGINNAHEHSQKNRHQTERHSSEVGCANVNSKLQQRPNIPHETKNYSKVNDSDSYYFSSYSDKAGKHNNTHSNSKTERGKSAKSVQPDPKKAKLTDIQTQLYNCNNMESRANLQLNENQKLTDRKYTKAHQRTEGNPGPQGKLPLTLNRDSSVHQNRSSTNKATRSPQVVRNGDRADKGSCHNRSVLKPSECQEKEKNPYLGNQIKMNDLDMMLACNEEFDEEAFLFTEKISEAKAQQNPKLNCQEPFIQIDRGDFIFDADEPNANEANLDVNGTLPNYRTNSIGINLHNESHYEQLKTEKKAIVPLSSKTVSQNHQTSTAKSHLGKANSGSLAQAKRDLEVFSSQVEPKLRVEFEIEALNRLEKRYQSHYSVQPNYIETKQKHLTWNMRAVLVDWVMHVCYEFSLKRETFHIAVAIVDKYLQAEKNQQKSEFQLIGAAAMFIAAKLQEFEAVTSEDFSRSTDFKYTAAQIRQTEKKICVALRYELNPPTLWMWANRFMLQWDLFLEETDAMYHPFFSQSHHRVRFFKKHEEDSYILFRELMQMVDCSILDVQTHQFPPKILICSLIYLVLGKTYKEWPLKKIVEEFPRTSSYLTSTYEEQYAQKESQSVSCYNHLFHQFLKSSFKIDLLELLPAIQYCSTFFTLTLVFDEPLVQKRSRGDKREQINGGLIGAMDGPLDSDEQLQLEEYESYQTYNGKMIEVVKKRFRGLYV